MAKAKIAARIYDGMFSSEREAVVTIDGKEISVLVDQSFVGKDYLEVLVVAVEGDTALIDLNGDTFWGSRRRFVPIAALSALSDAA
jgi:hypothetical protein